MHQRKSSKKKAPSIFVKSDILTGCLLPGGVNAEERSVQKEQVQYEGFQKIDGKTYYFDPNNNYRMAKGWFKIGEDWYRTNEDGTLNKGILSRAKSSARKRLYV